MSAADAEKKTEEGEKAAAAAGELLYCGGTNWDVMGRKAGGPLAGNLVSPTRLRPLVGVDICFVASGCKRPVCHSMDNLVMEQTMRESSVKLAYEPQPRPRAIAAFSGKTIVKVACGTNHTGGGQLYMWGKLKTTGDDWMYPKPVMDLSGWNIRCMASGYMHHVVGAEDSCISWGHAQYGELGYGPLGQKSSANPKKVDILNGMHVTSVACGLGLSLIVVDRANVGDRLDQLEAYNGESSADGTEENENDNITTGKNTNKIAANSSANLKKRKNGDSSDYEDEGDESNDDEDMNGQIEGAKGKRGGKSSGRGRGRGAEKGVTQSKASSDKRRWSFRKRSARHRVLSNSVVSEPVSISYNKESAEVVTNTFDSPIYSSIPEKKSIEQRINETFPLPSAVVDSEIANPLETKENFPANDINLNESVAIVIQAATRGDLARREFQRLKSIVKLQAAVRGHLVRRQAIGTLHCIQAIVKLQAFVRARRTEKSAVQEDKLQEKGYLCIRPNKTYPSTKILLSNRFACQATPKKKPIQIKCDTSKSDDSAWKWLERWMAVTSSDIGQHLEQKLNRGHMGQEANTELADYEARKEVPPVVSMSSDAELAPNEIRVPTNGEGDVTTKSSGTLKFEAAMYVPDNHSSSLVKDDQQKTQIKNETLGITVDNCTKIENVHETIMDSLSSQKQLESNPAANIVLDNVSEKHDFDCNSLKNTSKSAFFEPVAEGKKLVQGLRKPCNPAFAAAQSKFEALSSTSSISWSSTSACQDAAAKSKLNSFQVDASQENKDIGLTDNSVSRDPRVQNAASECGTEISISSTLDSPDRSETEGGEIVLEIGALEKGHYDVNGDADTDHDLVKMNTEEKNSAFDSEVLQSQRYVQSDGNLPKSTAAKNVVQWEHQPSEPPTFDMPTQLEGSIQSSPEGTPKSCTMVPESHGTPSSQTSVNAKKTKKDSNVPVQNQRSLLAGKGSPSNPNNDSGGRTSTEKLSRDSKNAKRRNSFGMAKSDRADNEPRISSGNSLPSYMQATESARAKAHASISPKLSPDVHDNHMKKRHSLPMANGKQGSSPRMQRSTSQAQQNSKGNATHSPHNSAGESTIKRGLKKS
ncbi:putative protein IQ-DOMAIN 32 [Cocos nucifera]|uniref:DUF4005 domain-containing protein n=1 Tax=Cocos nucifera TaxID=13894 RepID=A0A8K0IJ86_COCNU|nr:putative protein IQ-DOMAIN 32 [Cocos nucifera]